MKLIKIIVDINFIEDNKVFTIFVKFATTVLLEHNNTKVLNFYTFY